MNNDIKEDYCSFEVSKLLKEKGFNCKVRTVFGSKNSINLDNPDGFKTLYFKFDNVENLDINYIAAPTHALAIKWIRENLKLSIEIYWKNTGKIFFGTVYPISPLVGQCHFTTAASTHEAATENALMHTLKNLI